MITVSKKMKLVLVESCLLIANVIVCIRMSWFRLRSASIYRYTLVSKFVQDISALNCCCLTCINLVLYFYLMFT